MVQSFPSNRLLRSPHTKATSTPGQLSSSNTIWLEFTPQLCVAMIAIGTGVGRTRATRANGGRVVGAATSAKIRCNRPAQIQRLREDEAKGYAVTRPKRPRALVLLPTRELTHQPRHRSAPPVLPLACGTAGVRARKSGGSRA
eukprot:5693866-Pyramimonas_sp.AAC.1